MMHDDEAWSGESATRIKGRPDGATVWRWELAADDAAPIARRPGATIVSREKLSARLDTLPKGPLLLRGDSVAFPPGGCAYLHRHQGPGIRCLLEGGIRIDTPATRPPTDREAPGTRAGRSRCSRRPRTGQTRFIRVMILPMAYLAKSSVEYLRDEDKDKPRTQKYKIYADMPIALRGT